ncbi:MAG TPA: class I SAM-dependent methyltransferase [Myxococcota bacterium]|nr:class I SAM-dependent methyltransferase [Myxococcota bacterium]
MRDLDAWLEHHRGSVLARRDLPEDVLQRLGAPRALAKSYGVVDGELVHAVREIVASLDGDLVDLGCGVGWHGRSDVIGVDQDFDMCRTYPGPAVCGDGADPPFDGEQFDGVLLLNILDSCQHSGLVLGQEGPC